MISRSGTPRSVKDDRAGRDRSEAHCTTLACRVACCSALVRRVGEASTPGRALSTLLHQFRHRSIDLRGVEGGDDLLVGRAVGAVTDQPAAGDRVEAAGPGGHRGELEAEPMARRAGPRVGDGDQVPAALAVAERQVDGAVEHRRRPAVGSACIGRREGEFQVVADGGIRARGRRPQRPEGRQVPQGVDATDGVADQARAGRRHLPRADAGRERLERRRLGRGASAGPARSSGSGASSRAARGGRPADGSRSRYRGGPAGRAGSSSAVAPAFAIVSSIAVIDSRGEGGRGRRPGASAARLGRTHQVDADRRGRAGIVRIGATRQSPVRRSNRSSSSRMATEVAFTGSSGPRPAERIRASRARVAAT